jgi:hypothetical protein
VNHDTLLTAGWLDLSKGPQVLHVPNMAGRSYSVQFTNPSYNTNFAYVGTRATGTQAGDYLMSGPGWKGQAPSGMMQISSFEADTTNTTMRLATQPIAHKS